MSKVMWVAILWLISSVAVAKELGLLVEVLTSEGIQLTGIPAAQSYLANNQGLLKVYSFDGVKELESRLSEGMEGVNEVEAKRLLQHRMDQMGRQVMQDLAEQSYMALLLANRYQIDRYPAVIINRQQVIYGVTDVMNAIRRALPVTQR
jgi:integrating conjugative element protein (TIGR03757 family)